MAQVRLARLRLDRRGKEEAFVTDVTMFLLYFGAAKIASDFLDRAMTMQSLPDAGYLRLSQIIGKPAKGAEPAIPAIIPVSRWTWWEGVKAGRYPQPVRSLGRRITAWRVEDIRALITRTDG